MIVALLGFGTVGRGVYDIINPRNDITIKYILDLVSHDDVDATCVTDYNIILNDNEVDTVIEVIGGINPSYDYITKAIKSGKNVVSTNKLVISTYYDELNALASKNGVSFRYTAAVGGGIPWLINLERAARVSELTAVYGIMNGTCNYILDSMHSGSSSFADALKMAQEQGFAERDPSADIDGIDTLCKVIISSNIAFATSINSGDIDVCGIRDIDQCDIAACESNDSVCRFMAYGYKTDNKLSVFVEPTFVKNNSLEASVLKNLNLISFEGKYVERESFFGFGAGRYPTAYTVVEDCLDIINNCPKIYSESTNNFEIDNELISHSYYVRTDYNNEWFDSLSKKTCGNGFIIEPVSVAKMHSFCKMAKENNFNCFIAGISE